MALDELQDQKSFGAHWSRFEEPCGDVRWKKTPRTLSAELCYHCPPAGPPQWYKPVDPTSDSCLQIPELLGFNLWVWPERARNRAMEPCNPGTLKTRNPCRALKTWNPESWGLGTLRTVQP